MHFIEIGEAARPSVVFAHGWARTHQDFIPAAESLGAQMTSLLVDLPGFGKTPRPEGSWTTADYADDAAAFIRERTDGKIVWVGHSFGARVGLRLAVKYPELLAGLLLVAAAGIPAQRSAWRRLRGNLRQTQFRMLRSMSRDDETRDSLEARFGSPDYVQSRKLGLRDVFMNAVREDQTSDLGRIAAPTIVLTGEKDTETPPEIGRRMSALIGGSQFYLLPECDHISILYRGRHVIALKAKDLVAGRVTS